MTNQKDVGALEMNINLTKEMSHVFQYAQCGKTILKTIYY